MKTRLSVLWLLVVFLGLGLPVANAQINRKIKTKNIARSNLSDLTGPLPIKKTKERDFKNKLVKDVSKVTTKEMKVAGTYFNKRIQRRWKITPDRAFGAGNLGFAMYSGQLWRQYFFVEGHLRGDEPVAYSGHITFDARQGRVYLIKVTTGDATAQVYINAMAGSTSLKTHGKDGYYPILLQASESGAMKVAVSARYRAGQSERYPEPLLIREITIDEL